MKKLYLLTRNMDTQSISRRYFVEVPTDLSELALDIKDYFDKNEHEILYPFCSEFNVVVIVEKVTYNSLKTQTENLLLNHRDISVFKKYSEDFKHIILGEEENVTRFLTTIVHNPDDTGIKQTYLPYAIFIDANNNDYSIEKLNNHEIPLKTISNFVRSLSSVDYDLNVLENHDCYLYCDESNHCLDTDNKTISYDITRLNYSNYVKGNCVIVGNFYSLLNFLNSSECMFKDNIIHSLRMLYDDDNQEMYKTLMYSLYIDAGVRMDYLIYDIL